MSWQLSTSVSITAAFFLPTPTSKHIVYLAIMAMRLVALLLESPMPLRVAQTMIVGTESSSMPFVVRLEQTSLSASFYCLDHSRTIPSKD
jgi:hypothetical protein